MKVRPASEEDVPSVASAYLNSWRAGYAGLLADAEIEVQARSRASYDWKRAIRGTDRVVLLAEEEGSCLGVAECEHNPETGRVPWLQMLYVVPSAWGTGTAKALLDEALAAVRRAGRSTTWLEVVEAQVRARRFYEREGWKQDTSRSPTTNGLFRLLYYRHDASGS